MRKKKCHVLLVLTSDDSYLDLKEVIFTMVDVVFGANKYWIFLCGTNDGERKRIRSMLIRHPFRVVVC